MSNLFQGISSGLAELKNYYQGPMVDQFNEDLPVLRGSEKVKQGWSGYQVVRPLRVRRNQGIGATSDGGTLPAIGRQTTVQASFQSAFNYLRFGVTGPMIKASQNDRGSFVRSAAYELEMGYKDLSSDINRQLSWDGSGTLAQVNTAAVASTTLVVKGRESVEPALKFLDVGMMVDIYNGSTAVATSIQINAISGSPTDSTATLTLSTAVTCSADDKVIRSGSYGYEMKGLLYSMDGGTSTIYGVDRSTYQSYQGNSVDLNNAQQLKLDTLQQAWNAGMNRGGAKYSAIYCDFDSLRMYQKLLTADKRYNNTVKGDGGFAEKDKFYLDFNGIAMVPDKDCPRRFFFLTENTWKQYVLADLEFADETGSMYIAQTSADQFEVRVRYFAQLFNEQPSAQAVVQEYLAP